MDIKIGYPDFTYNDTYLDELYKDVIDLSLPLYFRESENIFKQIFFIGTKYVFKEAEFFKNSIVIAKIDTITQLSELRKDRDRGAWLSGPAVVNAFYSPPANQICNKKVHFFF